MRGGGGGDLAMDEHPIKGGIGDTLSCFMQRKPG